MCDGEGVTEYPCECGREECENSVWDECVACNGTGFLTYKSENIFWH